MNLRSALTSLRHFSCLSQADFNKAIDMNHGWVSRIERGEYNPELKTVEKYAEVLGMRVSHIVSFSEVIDQCEDWRQQIVTLAEIIKND